MGKKIGATSVGTKIPQTVDAYRISGMRPEEKASAAMRKPNSPRPSIATPKARPSSRISKRDSESTKSCGRDKFVSATVNNDGLIIGNRRC